MLLRLRNADKLQASRRGAVSIWAIVCLVFVTAVSATLGRLAILGSRHMLQERRRSQAEWLAQAGWSLAATQLEKNADYKGETWNIPAADLGGADGGRVKVDVSAPASDDAVNAREVTVVAEFPVDSVNEVRMTRRRTMQLPKRQGTSEPEDVTK